MTAVLPTPLSEDLRARTAAAHAAAEHSPFLSALAAGRVSADGWAALVGRLLPVYEALERVAGQWAQDPRVGGFVQPALHRAARSRADLEHLTGRRDAAVTPAAVAYAARVEEVARRSAPAFVAHHYTRYLGDLSGGQVVRGALARSLGVGDGTGASSLHFPDLRPATVKREYRERLDTTPFSHAEREELVGEALLAYRLNVALTAELDADLARWTTS